MSKIQCNNKYELCQICKQTHVPVTSPLLNGMRLCTSCSTLFAYIDRYQEVEA